MLDPDVLNFIRTDATHGATCRALADAGQDSAVAQIVSAFAPQVKTQRFFTDRDLCVMFGFSRGSVILNWLSANFPVLVKLMQEGGVDLSLPEVPNDLATFVAAGGITQLESNAVQNAAYSPDTITHQQVTRVLTPLRTADSDGSIRSTPINWS
jgi:hypothetical protein